MSTHITLYVGVSSPEHDQYYPSAESVLSACRTIALTKSSVSTNSEHLFRGFLTLHRLGKVTVKVFHVPSSTEIRISQDGSLIDIWPDEWMSNTFNLNFYEDV